MKHLLLFLVTAICCFAAWAQDVINPYLPLNPYPLVVNIGNPSYVQIDQKPYILNNNSQYYNGEFEIGMEFNYWYSFIGSGQNICNSAATTLCFSYNYEVVGFPFVNECAYIANTCDDTPDRILKLPDETAQHFAFNPTSKAWYYNNNPNPLITNSALLTSIGSVPFVTCEFSTGTSGGGGPIANTLTTAAYTQLSGFGNTYNRRAIPHSIIKVTVYAHCSWPQTNSNIIDQFSFYYDNTRGRMRYYPFIASNTTATSDQQYDVVFFPMLIKNQNEIDYQANNNSIYLGYDEAAIDEHMVMPNGGLNYFRHSEINPSGSCITTYPVPTQSVGFYDLADFYYPAYSYITAPLRTGYGNYIAGYESNGGNIGLKPGIQQEYVIDQNTDLNIINPNDKIIYNPSEATITANNFIFPQDYTFKTIHGVYPTIAEVTAANIQANGFNCSGCDLRIIPANTDLTSEEPSDATNFPLSAQASTQHLYASRYYLDNGGNTFPKLTIENCVGLFDCTFDVKPGSTMEFNDYTLHYGTEDNSYTNTGNRSINRFKIQTLGGAVLRNLAPIQYLQNGNITQSTALHYTATQDIFAGNNVDPDADINALSVNHDYKVQSGADVTLEANNTIYLKDGFSALSGSTFTAKIAATTLAAGTPCPSKAVYPRLAGNESTQNKKTMEDGLLAFPNPTSGILTLYNNNKPILAKEITITDAFGRTVFEKTNFNSMRDVIDFSSQPNGVYLAKVLSNGNKKPLRFVVNH